jgi:hypothetical protein
VAQGISNTNSTIVATFRIGFFSDVSVGFSSNSVQSNKIRSETSRLFSSLDKKRGGPRATAFLHRSALFVWVLEGKFLAFYCTQSKSPQ